MHSTSNAASTSRARSRAAVYPPRIPIPFPRGEAPLGIVYATDALIDSQVRVVGTFPESSHASITYPAAATTTAKPGAAAFLAFLGSREAAPVWKKHGFLELAK